MILFLRRHALYFAWVIALAGFCLSIFYGEVLQYEPCPLCWYQRMALFPLVLLLGMAVYRNDAKIVVYAIPFAILGCITALFQIFESHVPFLQKAGICHHGELCSQTVFSLFGFLSFPLLSALGFVLIAALLALSRHPSRFCGTK